MKMKKYLLALMGTVGAVALTVFATAPAQALTVATGWYYRCSYRSAWWDPWNFWGTYGQVCEYIWK